MNDKERAYEIEHIPVADGSTLSDGRPISDALLRRPTMFTEGGRITTGSGIKTLDDGTERVEPVVMIDLDGAMYTYVVTPEVAEKLGAALVTVARRSREEARQPRPRR